jgi:hypothetical protein
MEGAGYGTEGGVLAGLEGFQLRYASPMADETLHIVDGESSGGTLKVSGLARPKDILRWKDALYTGPVPSGLGLKKLSAIRSRFWTLGKRKDE